MTIAYLRRLLASTIRAAPAPLARFIGRRQSSSGFWRRVGGVAKRAMNSDGVIAHGEGAGLRFNAGGGNAGYALGTSEPEVQAAFASRLQPGQTVYDLGANAGFYTVIAARLLGAGGEVIACEPLPENAELIEHNARLNGFRNIRCLRLAVGRESGSASFTLGFDRTRGGLTDVHAEPGTKGTITVPVSTLDELCAQPGIRPPDLIKIDVEGAELDVLMGGKAMLERHRPTLLIEIHGTAAQLVPTLEQLGYVCALIGADGAPAEAAWGDYVIAQPRVEAR